MLPLIKDAIPDIAKAGSAKPFFAIRYPSRVVNTAPASPSTFKGMLKILPPNSAP
ncbi:Hypothetical protein CFV354_0982 [Campylobacter fetus subsp. venerealis NCTC 10354]|nr:Hypothetical protein CFV354_0982 [Campylobacter fetus subsp. venerealis NCTC 10354]